MLTVAYAYASLIKVTELFSYIVELNGVILNVSIMIVIDETIGGIE